MAAKHLETVVRTKDIKSYIYRQENLKFAIAKKKI